MIIASEFLTWFFSVLIFGSFSDVQAISGLKVGWLNPSDAWSALYVADVSDASKDFLVDWDSASFLSRRRVLNRCVGASGTMQRGKSFKS